MFRKIALICVLSFITAGCAHKGNGGWVVGNGLAPKDNFGSSPATNVPNEKDCGCGTDCGCPGHGESDSGTDDCGCSD